MLILIALLIGISSISNAQVQAPSNPNSAKSCAICHYRWVDTFFIEGRGSDLVEYTAEKMVATPEMCFSCHDGSIADSRARAYETAQHKTNTPPPDHMKIPDIFPLDDKGNMQCATCHTAHGVPSGPDSKETIFMRTSNRNSAMCRMCHPNMIDGEKAANHPIDITKQKIPPKLIAMGALEGDERNRLICETCHTAHGAKYESYLIESAKDSGLCLVCHDDKNNLTPEGQKNQVHVVNVSPQTAQIPTELLEKGARVGDNGEILCQSCHKVHNNKLEQPFLLVARNEQSSLCLTCHSNKQYISDTKHNLLLTAPNEKNLTGKTVAQAGVCSACHLPHKPARKLSGNTDFATQICLSCHSNGNIAEKSRLTGSQHPLDIRPPGVNGNAVSPLPLYDKSGFQVQSGTVACATCHDPHRWRPDSPAQSSDADSRADRTSAFLRIQAPQICRECHANKFHVTGSKHDLSKTAPDATNMKNQSPVESGICGTCHQVHNAQDVFLWARKSSDEARDITGSLCLGCHNRNGSAARIVIRDPSHPVNTSPAANGLTTTLPLFDPGGTTSENGVVSCPTCHDPHRWDPSTVSSGDHFTQKGSAQNSFLRLETSPSAKLCEDCHPAQARVEKTEHDLLVTVPSSKNIVGQSPLESGTCGVCHLTHNGRSEIVLWGRGYGPGNNVMETMCNSCHSPEGAAKTKVPPVYLHPREKLVKIKEPNKKGRPEYFPLFHGYTGVKVASGNISCPSCHNVHQWNPEIPARGSGVNTEGDAANSFLRSPVAFEVCKECHGKDAPFKKKYYHNPAKRKFKSIDEMFFQ